MAINIYSACMYTRRPAGVSFAGSTALAMLCWSWNEDPCSFCSFVSPEDSRQSHDCSRICSPVGRATAHNSKVRNSSLGGVPAEL